LRKNGNSYTIKLPGEWTQGIAAEWRAYLLWGFYVLRSYCHFGLFYRVETLLYSPDKSGREAVSTVMSDIVIRIENVFKKFCKALKGSMFYGVIDIARGMLGFPNNTDVLRKDAFWAVQDVSFEVKQGEVLGIIGPNGSGKTTLLKMINGIFMPDKGKIEVNGRVGALIEVGAGFHPLLTGMENIYINGAILGMSKKEIDKKFDEIVEFADIGDFLDTPVKYYSSGMFVRLGFSIAIHAAPEIMLVDEVLAVGDATFQRKCLKVIKSYAEQGRILIFITHNILAIYSIGNQCLVLDGGRNVYYGDTQQAAEIYHKCTINRHTELVQAATENAGEMRYGTGAVQITKFKSHPQQFPATEDESIPLLAGQPAVVSVQITARIDTERLDVGFSLWEQSDLPLVAFNTQSIQKTLPRMKAGESVTLHFIFTCPLASGRYRVSAGILNAVDNTFMDRRINWLTIEVAACGEEFGLLSIPYDISIQPSGQTVY
jgi:ABC-type polysaccharide/polyol phosphate transport system ATPase subunit